MLAQTIEEGVKDVKVGEGKKDLLSDFAPKDEIKQIAICEISSEEVGKIYSVEGILRSSTGIIPGNIKSEFICGKCNAITNNKPIECSLCHNKKFREQQNFTDLIKCIIEEDYVIIDHKNNRDPATLVVVFTKDLKDVIYDVNLGGKYSFIGEIKIMPDAKKPYFFMDVHSFFYQKDGIEAYNFTPTDIERFKQYSETPDLLKTMREGIFGNDIYGVEKCMEVALLVMAGSQKVYTSGVMRNRGNIMALFIGSPGKGKSMLLKRVAAFFPKSRYVACTGATSIGLTASVRKDEVLGIYVVEPGAVALCNGSLGGGIACIDEFDKLPKEEAPKLNTQMDTLTIPIDKANIHRLIKAEASILAGMNPKYTTFDSSSDGGLYDQINLTKDVIDRFDTVYNFDFFIGEGNDSKILDVSMKAYYAGEEEPVRTNRDFLRKYLCYARTITPKCDEACINHIKEEFQKLLGKRDKTHYYSVRLSENLVRMVCGYARLRLSDNPDFTDVKKAVELMSDGFRSLGLLIDGRLNVFEVENIPTPKKRDNIEIIKQELKNRGGRRNPIPAIDIMEAVGMEEDEFDKIIKLMIKVGDIFEPRNGLLALL